MLAGVSRRTESIAYQSTRTVRRTRLPQGAIKKMSLAVLVDQTARWEGTGKQRKRVLEPPAPATLKAIRDLVAGVVGFTPDRGDQLTVEALPFESTLHPESETGPVERVTGPAPSRQPAPRWLEMLHDPKILGGAIGAAVLLVAGVVVWLVLGRRKGGARASSAPALQPGGGAGGGLSLEEQMQARLAEQAALDQKLEQEALSSIKLPKVATKKTEVLARQVRENAKKDASVGAHVLKAWIGEQMPLRKDL
jgi:flagellar M-ring protein FliF